MNHFSPSLYIVFCITNSRCIGGPNSCVSRDGSGGKKGQVSPFVAEEIVESSATTDFQICHLSWHLSYGRKALPKREREGWGGGNHNWSFFYLFPLFPFTSSVNKIKMPPSFESQGRAPLGRAEGSLRDRRRPDKE